MTKQDKFIVTIPPSSDCPQGKVLHFKTAKEVMELLKLPSYSVLYNLAFRNGVNKTRYIHQSTKHLKNIRIERIQLNKKEISPILTEEELELKEKEFVAELHNQLNTPNINEELSTI